MSDVDQVIAKGLDKGRFTNPRRTRYTDANCLPGRRHQRLEQRHGVFAMVCPGRFDQRDALGQCAAIAAANPLF